LGGSVRVALPLECPLNWNPVGPPISWNVTVLVFASYWTGSPCCPAAVLGESEAAGAGAAAGVVVSDLLRIWPGSILGFTGRAPWAPLPSPAPVEALLVTGEELGGVSLLAEARAAPLSARVAELSNRLAAVSVRVVLSDIVALSVGVATAAVDVPESAAARWPPLLPQAAPATISVPLQNRAERGMNNELNMNPRG
jgi:hypothetical protein